jgi:carbon storage regulator CsrA
LLILSRKLGETICIGKDGIEVTVLSLTGDRASLGVTGPREAKAAPGERRSAASSLSPAKPQVGNQNR